MHWAAWRFLLVTATQRAFLPLPTRRAGKVMATENRTDALTLSV